MNNIVIVGAGDLGKEVVWLIEDINRNNPKYLILGFLDNDPKKIGSEFFGYKVLGRDEDLETIAKNIPLSAVIAIQNGSIRKKISEKHKNFSNWETIVHPTAVIASSSRLGKGSIVFPQVTVSVDTRMGDFTLLYIHSTICNDCDIADFVSVMSGVAVSERAVIGNECFLAAGCTINPHKRLGNCVEVGVGATACKDYADGARVSEKGMGFSLFK